MIIYLFLSYALGCKVYYNKDLLFDFRSLHGNYVRYGDGQSLFINVCSLLDYKCVKSTRLLADAVDINTTTTNTTTDTNTTITNTTTANNTITNTTTTNTTIDPNITTTTNTTIDTNTTTTNTTVDTNTTDTTAETNTTIDKNNTVTTDDDDDDDDQYVLKEDVDNPIHSIIIENQDHCQPLSEQIGVDKEQVTLVNEKQPLMGVILKRRGIIEKDVIKLELVCTYDEDESDMVILDVNNQQFKIKTQSACPILLQNPMIGFFDDFKWMFSIVLWVVGIFLLGFGYQLAQLSSIIMAAIMGFGFTTVVIGEAALDYDSSGAALSVVVGAGVIVGFIYLNASVTRFFFLLFNFGFAVGVVISLMIQSMFYYSIETDLMYFPLGTSIIVLGIVLGLLGLRYNLEMGIISTSLVGAYCLIRPWGFILGGYPNELLLTKQADYGLPIKLGSTVYFYNLLILLVAIGCGIYQRKQHLKRVAFDDQLSTDIKYYEMGKVQEEKERQSKGSDQNVTVHFAKHLDNEPEPQKRYSHLTGSDKNE